MAKKPTPPAEEFTVPPETITKGGSYVVDPVKKTVDRVAHTKPAAGAAAASGTADQSASQPATE